MKFIYLSTLTVLMLIMASAGYTASTESDEPVDTPSSMEMSGMHGKETMHGDMMGHHMMRSGVSPVTIMIQPGMMPTMSHGMMKHGANDGHKSWGMGKDKMNQRHEMMKEHMERMEQRLANIEALLSQLVELQSKN